MFRCKGCGHDFEEFATRTETHNLDSGPYEEISVCPRCKKDVGVIELTKNIIARTKMLDMLLDALKHFNAFENKIEGFLHEDIEDEFFKGKQELWDMFCVCADDTKNPLPSIVEKIFLEAKTEDDFEVLENVAKRYIEGAL